MTVWVVFREWFQNCQSCCFLCARNKRKKTGSRHGWQMCECRKVIRHFRLFMLDTYPNMFQLHSTISNKNYYPAISLLATGNLLSVPCSNWSTECVIALVDVFITVHAFMKDQLQHTTKERKSRELFVLTIDKTNNIQSSIQSLKMLLTAPKMY